MFKTTIPTADPAGYTVELSPGESLFLVGANGTGKSSLMHQFFSAHHANARRISAHRQTWFTSGAITLSPEQKRQTESHVKGHDTHLYARWKDDYSAQRASMAIYDLLDAENVRARSIAQAVDVNQIDLAKKLSLQAAPLKVINELLRLSNIPVEISVHQNEQIVASRSGSPTYTALRNSLMASGMHC